MDAASVPHRLESYEQSDQTADRSVLPGDCQSLALCSAPVLGCGGAGAASSGSQRLAEPAGG